jgi:hypothetical protein
VRLASWTAGDKVETQKSVLWIGDRMLIDLEGAVMFGFWLHEEWVELPLENWFP